MRKIFIIIVLLVLVVPETNANCPRLLKKIALTAGALTIGYLQGPTLIHELQAKNEDKEHIGYGIYFSLDDITSALKEEERVLLGDKEKNALEIFTIFTSKLSGGYDHEAAETSAPPAMVPKKNLCSRLSRPKMLTTWNL